MHWYLQRAWERINETAGPMSPVDLAADRPGKWSAAEILEHLTLAFTGTRISLEKALASGELRARAPVLRQRLARTAVTDFGYFPRVQAPERTTPRGSIPPEAAVAAAKEALRALDGTLSRVADRFGSRALVSNHPFFGGLTVDQWRKFHWRHTHHHMKQIGGR
jgi:hypothetical protein